MTERKMGGRRGQLAMTQEEIDDFLASHWMMVLGTLGPTGAPHLVTMGYGVWDGRLTFSSYRKAQKIKNLERDPRVTCLIEDIGQSYDQIRGVSVRGTATMIDDPQVLIERARATDRSGNVYAAAAKPMEEMAAKRVLVVVEPERVLSWDHRHLGGKY